MSAYKVAVQDDTFQAEVLDSDVPVLVDWWASWCGPCKMIEPFLEEIAEQRAGTLKIARINADEHSQAAMSYGVMGLPTLLLFQNGQASAERLSGYVTKQDIIAYLDAQIDS